MRIGTARGNDGVVAPELRVSVMTGRELDRIRCLRVNFTAEGRDRQEARE